MRFVRSGGHDTRRPADLNMHTYVCHNAGMKRSNVELRPEALEEKRRAAEAIAMYGALSGKAGDDLIRELKRIERRPWRSS